MARVPFYRSPAAPTLMLVLVLFGAVSNWTHPIRPQQQVHVHRRLIDWSLHSYTRNGGQTLHFRITGYAEEFRVDPGLVRDLMGNRLPAGFTKGAMLDVTADAAQIATPIHPLLQPDVAIVWANGLSVNGVPVLAFPNVLRHRHDEWSGWVAVMAMLAGYFGYTITEWRKRRASA